MNTTLADLWLIAPELILVGSGLVLILASRRVQKASLATGVTVTAALASALLAAGLAAAGSQTGFGGLIVVDGYSQFFKILIATVLVFVALLSTGRLERDRVRAAEYNVLLLLAGTGMMVTASAVDLLTLYLGLELTTLSAYSLVGITVERPTSTEAAIKYFLLGSFASALLLYGIALLYGLTGSTDFEAVSRSLFQSGSSPSPVLLAAIGLVVAGLAFKLAAAPFHAWTPDAYQGATVPVAAFLAAASKAAGLAAMGRVCLIAFASESNLLSWILAGLAGLSIIVGSVVALSQNDLKRLLAYSSISHVGYALLGLVAGTAEGTSATMTYAFLYVFMTVGAFAVVVALGDRGETLEGYRGLAAQRPRIAALMLLFLLSLTGIPPTAGFAAKFVVILNVVRAGHVALAVVAVVFSVVSAFVYLRVAVLMYMREPEAESPAPFPLAVSAVLVVTAAVTLIGGIFPGSVILWSIAPS